MASSLAQHVLVSPTFQMLQKDSIRLGFAKVHVLQVTPIDLTLPEGSKPLQGVLSWRHSFRQSGPIAGRPIAWFGRPLLAYAMYLPAAVAGALLPYTAVPKPSQQAAITHGAAIAHAALAALMSAAGLKSSFALALWALTGVLCLLCPRQASSAPTSFAPQCKHNSTEA